MATLELQGLTKRFGEFTAVDSMNLKAAEGEMIALLGGSGCGKTTTLRMIAGFTEPTAGQILVDGKNVSTIPPYRRNIGIFFQNYALFPHMTVFENVAFGLKLQKLPKNEIRERVEHMLALVKLTGMDKRYPRQLSGGQQQRVALARALVTRPSILLLDEPLSNLDAKLRVEMQVEIKRIQKELGITTIIVTHDHEEAVSLADRVIVMNAGHILQIGKPQEVFDRPASPFIADFMGFSTFLHGIAAGAEGDMRLIRCGAHTLQVPAEAAPQYPQMAPYPDETKFSRPNGDFDSDGFNEVYNAWQADRRKQTDQPEGYTDVLDGYLRAVIPQLLTGGSGENKVCSPLNIYMALAMLAEVTDGESREQILALLGSGDVNALRAEAAAVWNANYCDDGAVTSILANSLWLSDKISFKQETMDTLAKHYYASSFRGEMGSAAFDKALQDWIDQQTGGLLKEQASGLTMDQETILALASTIYFRAKWNGEFSEANTAPDTFHADSGDMTCDFMRQRGTNTYYWSDRFSAVSKRLEGSGAMWFLLPDEGVAPEELLADEAAMDFLLSGGESAESKYLIVNLALPKFDIASDLDLADSLKSLGITDVFDPAVSDFSPMTDDTAAYLSQAKHAARVAVDEEGVTAAAYTVMMVCGAAAPPEEEVDFVLNRPFLFAITGTDDLPLFVGIVHQPQP